MAIDPKEGLFEHAQFAGLRNVVPEDRFELEDLSLAKNVDIDDSKRVTRRKGHSAPVVAGASRSLWSDGNIALVVSADTNLTQIHADFTTQVLRSGLAPGRLMSYASWTDRVYYSNGEDTGVVDQGTDRTWGLEPPALHGVASEIGGVLPAGRYQFAVTYRRADGQESGTQRAGVIELAATGGINLVAIPDSSDPGVTGKVVYFSRANGENLYRAGVIGASTTTFSYMIETAGLVPLLTQHLRPAPAGDFVDVFNGRTLVAAGNVLYPSEPFAPELFDLRKAVRFAGPIVLLAALESGVWIGTDAEIIWLDGRQPDKWVHTPKLQYGAIRGASTRCSRDMLGGPGDKKVVILATREGICVGADDGTISNLTQDRFLYPQQDRGAVVVRRHRGMIQCLAALQGTEVPANASS